jgi:hypothetical protein
MRRLTEKQIRDSIQTIDFEPLKIKLKDRKEKTAEDAMLLVIGWKNGSEYFLPEILGEASPKQVDLSLFRIGEKTVGNGEKKSAGKAIFPIIIAPYLSEQTLNRLAEAEISGIDLSGNGVVVIPGKLFVYRAGAKNKFLSNAPIKNVFRGTSSLVPRVFFAKPEYENVGETLYEITKRGGKTTFPTVSKVLKTLEEELLIAKSEKVRLLDAKKLLDLLLKNYRRPQVRRTLSVKCDDLSRALEKMSKNSKKKNILFAWNYPARYTVIPSDTSAMKIYTESIDELLEGVDFAETSRFPDLILLETDEPTVYFDRRQEQDSYFLSPLEIFLQLSTEGKREQEAASLMIKKLLEFNY